MSTFEPTDAVHQQMKALRAHTRGGPEQLVYEDAPTPPAPQGDDALVKVAAAAITFDELTWPETWESGGVDRTPIIPSHEFAGTVVGTGPDAHGVAAGDEVFGLVPFNRNGAAAEYVLVPASSIAHRPSGVTAVTAAAAVLPALTAMEALDEQLQLTAGQRLLVRGGTGGVGAFVVQLAHRLGIEVTATVRSAEAAERARRLGAQTVLVGDEADRVAPASFDGSIDAAGAGSPEWLYRSVRPDGRVIMLQELPDAELAKRFDVDARFFVVSARAASLARLGESLATGEFEVAVAQTFTLAEGRKAYESRGRAAAPGKTVIDVAGVRAA
ncbi:NADP-dependent oxidoreductase [Gryllotalpicola daejeonensis]|uniref:NADP-dependent oxidoreductase n=1 Tax=Gryllotalpicola daejeonensis TaxID=993087 RepID=A0ABP7ZK26_9MICO